MVNQFETSCSLCSLRVPPSGGNECNGGFAHPACIEAARRGDKTPQVVLVNGRTQNKKGRCLDFPCCGCCQ